MVPTPELRAKQIRKRASPKRLGGEVLGRESEPEDPQAGVRSSVARVLGGFGGPSPRGGGPSELIRWGQVRTGGADRPGAVSRFLGLMSRPISPRAATAVASEIRCSFRHQRARLAASPPATAASARCPRPWGTRVDQTLPKGG